MASGDSQEGAGGLLQLAQAAVERSQWLEALDLASQALAADPTQVEAARIVGVARERLGPVSKSGPELRHVTVLAIDMYRSTAIAARLGPERMRQLMLELYEVCAGAVTRYEGRVTKYLGDGVLAHFGYPVTHEDDARRAVLASLAALEEIEARGPGWQAEFDVTVAARVGVDSGQVAVGPLDASPWSMDEIAGDPPNVASRVQAEADRMSVFVTESTQRLIEGWFETAEVGPIELRNYPRPVCLHRVIGPTGAETRLEASGSAMPPLLGRGDELRLLRDSWSRVTVDGERQVVSVTGEAGIGKSRLVEHVSATAVAAGVTPITLTCSSLFRESSLRPVGRALARFFAASPEAAEPVALDSIRRRLEQLPNRSVPTEDAVPIYAWLLGIRSALDAEPEELRRRSFDAVIDLFEATAASSGLVLCVEDFDTADPSTVALVQALLGREPVPMMVILTGRSAPPGLSAPDHSIELSALPADEASDLVAAVAPGLDRDLVDRIVTRSAGVPFFLEEQARAALRGTAGGSEDPPELSVFVAARLDELSPASRRLIQKIGVAGEEVRTDVLLHLSGLDPQEVERCLEEPYRRRMVVRHDGPAGEVVRFRHALVGDAAYRSLLESDRADLHRRLAEALSELDAGAPEDIARHYDRAGERESAARWWLRAGREAVRAGANEEALGLFRRSLAALEDLPEGRTRDALELDGRFRLGTVLSTVEGYTSPGARAAFERAVALAERLGDEVTVFPAIAGTSAYWFVLGEHGVVEGLVARMVRIAEQNADDPRFRLEGAYVTGYQRIYLGDFAGARRELERAADLVGIEPLGDVPQDPGILSVSLLAVTLWFLGENPRSREVAGQAMRLVAQLDPDGRRTALTECWVCANLAWRSELDGDSEGAIELADRAEAIASERGYVTWFAAATLHRAIAQCRLGRIDEGLPTLAAMVDAWRSAGLDGSGRQLHSILMTPYFAGRLAEALLAADRADEAAEWLDRLLEETARNGERFWDVELLRLRAEASRALGATPPRVKRDLDAARRLAGEQRARGLGAGLGTGPGAPRGAAGLANGSER